MAKLGVGVLGVGAMGKRHAFNIRHLIPEAQLIAVADADSSAPNKLPPNWKSNTTTTASKHWLSARISMPSWSSHRRNSMAPP